MRPGAKAGMRGKLFQEFQVTVPGPFPHDSSAIQFAQPKKQGREDGEADVVDVPQADGDSAGSPAKAAPPTEKPVKDNRARGWIGR